MWLQTECARRGARRKRTTGFAASTQPRRPGGTKWPSSREDCAYVEIDPCNTDDVKRGINDCGLVYVGFNMPQNVMPAGDDPPQVWDVDASNPPIVGGHCVILPGYDTSMVNVISWGWFYQMTWAFFAKYVDEVYAVVDNIWISAKRRTPAGLTVQELEAQMVALKE